MAGKGPGPKRQHPTIGSHLWDLYQNGRMTDLEIILLSPGDQKRETFLCHKIVMMRLSSVFESMIETTEQDEDEEGSCITINGVDSNILKKIIKFAYTDIIKLNTSLEALQMYKTSKTYDIRSLLNISMSYMEKNLTSEDLWFVLDNLQGLSDAQKARIMQRADQLLENDTEACLNAKGFLSCSQGSLQQLLSKEKLSIRSELQLITAATRWCQHQNSGVQLDCDRAQQLLGPCMQQLRMLSLSPSEFSQHVVPSGLLSTEDALATLMNINEPKNSPLPDIVCANRMRRTTTAGNSISGPPPPKQAPPTPPPKDLGKDYDQKPFNHPQGGPSGYYPGPHFNPQGGYPPFNNAPGAPPHHFSPQPNINLFNNNLHSASKPINKSGPQNSPVRAHANRGPPRHTHQHRPSSRGHSTRPRGGSTRGSSARPRAGSSARPRGASSARRSRGAHPPRWRT